MSKKIIDRGKLLKDTKNVTRWMDKKMFGVNYPQKKDDYWGNVLDGMKGEKKKGGWF